MDGDLSCSWMWDAESLQASSEAAAASTVLCGFWEETQVPKCSSSSPAASPAAWCRSLPSASVAGRRERAACLTVVCG